MIRNNVFILTFILCFLCSNFAIAQGSTLFESSSQIRGVAEKLHNSPPDQYKNDYLAENLYAYGLSQDKYYIDALAWAAKILGQSKDSRYTRTLEYIINSEAHAKIKKHAKAALKELPSENSAQYNQGDMHRNFIGQKTINYTNVQILNYVDTSKCQFIQQGSCRANGSEGFGVCNSWHRLTAGSMGADVVLIIGSDTQSLVNGLGINQINSSVSASYYICQGIDNAINASESNATPETELVKERLRKLKGILDDGLINHDDYEKRKLEILKDI